jgi:signal transduction histidine kinase
MQIRTARSAWTESPALPSRGFEPAAGRLAGQEFLALVSHELRGPLAAIQYSSRLIDEDRLSADERRRVRATIDRQLRRAGALLDDLTDSARIATGRLHLRCERIELKAIVLRAIETLEGDLSSRQLRLACALPPAPVWVDGDAGRLEQVLINLLTNATKYTDPGGDIGVSLTTRFGQACLAVRDSGIGIPAARLPFLFEPFTQANIDDPRSRSGLGIGLALVRALVEGHGGRVEAASPGIGAGSVFSVWIPTAD